MAADRHHSCDVSCKLEFAPFLCCEIPWFLKTVVIIIIIINIEIVHEVLVQCDCVILCNRLLFVISYDLSYCLVKQ